MASTKSPSVAAEKAKVAENQDIAILLKQNWQMEREISRLIHELDEATKGVLMRGYLYKFRDREISFASKWALRYFLLQGSSLSYFVDESERRPRRTIDLTTCSIRDEGPTKNGQHYIFSILCADSYDDIAIDSEYSGNVLLRLSSGSRAEAAQWIRALSLACAGGNSDPDFSGDQPDIGSNLIDGPELSGATGAGLLHSLSVETMRRVQSSTQILQKSLSRLGLAQIDPSFGLLKPAAAPSSSGVPDVSKKAKSTQALPALAETKEANTHVTKGKDKSRLFPGSKPIHMETKASPLSSDNTSRGSERSFRGFFNLGVIILLIANCRLIVENLQHHGFVAQIPQLGDLGVPGGPLGAAMLAVQCLGSWLTAIVLCYVIEVARFRRWLSESVSVALHFFFGALNIVVPVVWVWRSDTNPLLCMVYLFESVIIWMKLISYAHVNHDLRQVMRHHSSGASASASDLRTLDAHTPRGTRPLSTSADNLDKRGMTGSPSVTYFGRPGSYAGKDALNAYGIKDLEPPYLHYPLNLTLRNLLYFCVAPTLCYQLNYPRLPEIRWYYVASVVVRLCLFSVFMLFSVQQYILPALSHSIDGVRSRDFARIAEVILKISIPNTYAWLLMFYLFFHLWLNLLAELTRFGDRLFYKDWWNSRNISGYWKNWNLPVHHWMLRHLYYPLVNSGVSKGAATIVVFLFSALFHEVVISVPFRHVTLHAFFGMLAQAPLISLTRMVDVRFDNAFLGNVIFWCLFCIIGQPMGLIMVYYDLWNVKNVPAFVGFATEPLLSIVEGMYVARLGASEQAGMGASNFAQYSVAKLYNDPLLKTTTSLVAGKSGEELSASVSTAIITAMFIGVVQSIGYALFARPILKLVSVSPASDMYLPALQYLRWKALGVPASTVLIVANGIFRGRGDTQTPLYYNTLGTVVNLALDPLLMFTAGLGISGLGLAFSLSQWLIVLPLLYLLHQKTSFQIVGLEMNFLRKALASYLKAGSLIFLRTIAKISTYTMASSAAAKLGTTSMAAYTLTFSLGFTASQLCESLAVAAQALLARDMPLDNDRKVKSARHVVRRSLQLGLLVTLCLTAFTTLNLNNIMNQMTKSAEVRAVAMQVMPIVLLTQIFKGVSSSTGGILLGGLDWSWTTTGMILSSILSLLAMHMLPKSLYCLWISLSIFTSTQVLVALARIFSNSGPWKGLVNRKTRSPAPAES